MSPRPAIRSVRGVGSALAVVLVASLLWWLIDPAPPDVARGDRSSERSDVTREPSEGEPTAGDRETGEPDPGESEPAAPTRLAGSVSIYEDGESNPVGGAWVRVYVRTDLLDRAPWLRPWFNLYILHFDGGPQDLLGETTTDEEGRFALEVAGDQETLVVAGRDDLSPDFTEGRAGVKDLQVWLRRSASRTLLVRDTRGAAVAGAEVFVIGTGERNEDPMRPVAILKTDDAGTVTALLRNGGDIVIRAEGFATIWVDDVLERPDGVIVLEPGLPLAGTVVDGDGAPVEGASVHCSRGGWGDLVFTDDAGRFRLEGLPGARDDPCGLLVMREGYVRARASASAGDESVRVVLSGRGGIFGKIVHADGKPAPDATIRWSHPESNRSGKGVVDGEGAFEIAGAPSGTVVLWTKITREIVVGGQKYRTHAGHRVVEVREGVRTDGGRIVLEAFDVSFVSVKVVDPEGNPVAKATVAGGGRALGRLWVGTDASGLALRILALPPGTSVWIGAHPDDRNLSLAGMSTLVRTAASADAPPIELRLQPPGRRTIRLREADGSPLPPDLVAHVDCDDVMITVKEPHVLEVRHDPASWSDLRVTAPGRVAVRRQLAPAPVEVEIRLDRAACLIGRFVGDRPEYFIVTRGFGEDAWRKSVDLDGGGFRLEGVPPGRLHLLVTIQDRTTLVRTVIVEAGQTLDLGDLDVRPAARVRGRVFGPDGAPLGGVEVVHRHSHSMDPLSRASSGPDGAFELAITRMPGAILAFSREGLGLEFRAVPAETVKTPIMVRLHEGGRVRVRLIPAASPAEYVAFRAIRTDDSASWPLRARLVPSPEGEAMWLLADLPAEAIRLECRRNEAPGGPLAGAVEVRVSAGKTREVVLRLEPIPD
jgi:carboxypeptidase family protein